jgi:hypothetical protein
VYTQHDEYHATFHAATNGPVKRRGRGLPTQKKIRAGGMWGPPALMQQHGVGRDAVGRLRGTMLPTTIIAGGTRENQGQRARVETHCP